MRAPTRRSALSHPGVAAQVLNWVRASALASACLSSTLTSSSSGMASISSLRVFITLLIASPAPMKLAPREEAARVMKRELIEIHMDPSLTRSWHPPAIVVSATGPSTGEVPSIMARTRWRRMPVVTLVGQSGPPTKRSTLATVSLGSCRMRRIAFIASVLMPTAARIPTLLPSFSPMIFCWTTHAHSLVMKAHATAHTMATQKLPSKKRCPAAPSMTPLAT
mmetsp:Transcript_39685/g.99343  ORF Transcript_39685/g.99343 Transcript_39685/m.99343 type:complete len:222 (-) Transcript_39685:614-1279(-)